MNYELAAALGAETEPTEFYNLQTVQRQLNKLKPVTNGAARLLMSGARTTLDKALAIASKSGHDAVIKQTQRDSDKIREQLQALSSGIGSDPDEAFASGNSLKALYAQSFVTYNMALQGKRDAESISYFKEVISTLGELVEKAQKIGAGGTSVFKIVAGVAAVGVGGWLLYRLVGPKRRDEEDY